jgi:hypothetical protein
MQRSITAIMVGLGVGAEISTVAWLYDWLAA